MPPTLSSKRFPQRTQGDPVSEYNQPPQQGYQGGATPLSHKDAKANAKAAKAYAKGQRPWFKKKRFWLLGLIALIVIIVIASQSGGGGSKPSSTGTGTTANTKSTSSVATAKATAATTTAASKASTKAASGDTGSSLPIQNGDWKLVSVRVSNDGFDGGFAATGRVTYTGKDTNGGSNLFTLTLFKGSKVVGTVEGSASNIAAGKTASVQFISTDQSSKYVAGPYKYDFQNNI